MDAREVRSLIECNGFCGVDELNPKNETVYEFSK